MLPKIQNSNSVSGEGRTVTFDAGKMNKVALKSFEKMAKAQGLDTKVKPISKPKKYINDSLKKTKQSLSSITDIATFFDFLHKENSSYHEEMEAMEKNDNELKQNRHKEIMDVLIKATKNKTKAEKKIKKAVKKVEEPKVETKPTTKTETKAEAPKAEAPKAEAPKPVTQPAQPKVETAKPVAEAPKPATQPAQPKVETAKPVTTPAAPPPTAAPATPTPAIPKPSVSLPKATTVGKATAVAIGAGALGEAIAQGESAKGSYNAANMGTKNNKIVGVKGKLDLENMTVAEIIRRQSINWGDANESEKLFAVGKYQIIPSTLLEAVKKLSISTQDKFSGSLQEKIFNDYLLKIKRPAIAKYLNSPTDDPVLLHDALKQLSLEWASIADPDIPGGKSSHYGSGNKASMSVEEATALLKADRLKMQGAQKASELSENTKNIGQKIDNLSTENSDMKKSIAQTSSGTTILQVNNKSEQKKIIQLPEEKKRELNPTMQ